MLFDGLAHIKGLMPLLAVFPDRVEVALHHVVFPVDRSQTSCRLDENQAIHPIGHMLTYRSCRAVIDIEAGIEGLKGELRLMAGRRIAAGRSASGAGHGVKVDVVRKSAVRMIHEMKLHRVALTHANKLSRHLAAKGPEGILDSLGDGEIHLRDLQFHDELCRLACA